MCIIENFLIIICRLKVIQVNLLNHKNSYIDFLLKNESLNITDLYYCEDINISLGINETNQIIQTDSNSLLYNKKRKSIIKSSFNKESSDNNVFFKNQLKEISLMLVASDSSLYIAKNNIIKNKNIDLEQLITFQSEILQIRVRNFNYRLLY